MNKPEIISAQWPLLDKVTVVTTTRMGGVSKPPFDSFNLAEHVGDDPQAVAANRSLLNQYLNLPNPPVWLKQTHSSRAIEACHVINTAEAADALFTIQPKIVCAIMTADCLPIVLSDRDGQCIATLHAGWRGLVEGIIENTVAAMRRHCTPSMAWLGPAIGASAFEVKADVYQAYLAKNQHFASCFQACSQHAWNFDIYAAARFVLSRCGVEHTYGGDLCTVSDAQKFFSYVTHNIFIYCPTLWMPKNRSCCLLLKMI